METLKLEMPEKVSSDYDKEADVLYVSFGSPQPALTLDLGGGILARYVKETGQVVGLTMIGLSTLLKKSEQ